MVINNILKLGLKIIPQNETIVIDGIPFSGIAYIVVSIDGNILNDQQYFDESFIVFHELLRSTLKSGEYLLFTSVSGIADDAGWMPINVKHGSGKVIWAIEIDDNMFNYSFDKKEYINEVNWLAKEIEKMDSDIKLEPLHVIYPE